MADPLLYGFNNSVEFCLKPHGIYMGGQGMRIRQLTGKLRLRDAWDKVRQEGFEEFFGSV
jgi:hypothetical protein